MQVQLIRDEDGTYVVRYGRPGQWVVSMRTGRIVQAQYAFDHLCQMLDMPSELYEVKVIREVTT